MHIYIYWVYLCTLLNFWIQCKKTGECSGDIMACTWHVLGT